MSKAGKKSAVKAEAAHGYEFFGPPGVTLISIGLPLVCYLNTFLCNDIAGCPTPAALHPRSLTLERLKKETGWPGISGLASTKAISWTLAYYLSSLILQTFLPGQEVEGVELRSGGKLKYKFNSFTSTLLTLGVAAVGTFLQGADFPLWTFIWDNYTQLLTANLIISALLSTLVYMNSFSVRKGNKEQRELAAGGHSGNLIYDWFIGRELNPRVTLPLFGELDIKVFCELRPGMQGWILLNLAFIAHQYKLHGFVSDSILLVTLFQGAYVIDALYNEPSILSTIDITTDGFGFMLAFGDLVWLPFTYSWQARYLAIHPVQLGALGSAGVILVLGIGYYIFRSANNEKARFRANPKDPRVAHLKYIQTKTGSKLLTSGWWGTARHINYLGDWLMSWSYCLPTGIAGYVITQQRKQQQQLLQGYQSPGSALSAGEGAAVVQGDARGWGMLFTYFYMLYFAVLLIHRDLRDDEKCARKYGADWEEYKKRVPYKLVPYVY